MASHKILVIDDSGVIRNTVRGMLPEGNFKVLEAKDGIEGLNLVKQEHPNLIMLDFILPKLSGWEVYQQIQSHPEYQFIPLVLMSGRKDEVTGKIPEPFEYFEFIEKPFDKKVLIDAIKSAMIKIKRKPQVVLSAPTTATATEASSTNEVGDSQELNAKIIKMQAEIDGLKKQLAQMGNVSAEVETLKKQVNQLVTFIKQKLK